MTNHEAQVQIEAFSRGELRAACREAGIQYSKLDNAGMRGALIALLPAEDVVAEVEAAIAAAEEVVVTVLADEPRIGLKIEKDRPEQHGVKRPSAGGKCRAVWDALDLEPTADSKRVKALAVEHGWNPANASIEFYQWRKYNGITGRVAKA